MTGSAGFAQHWIERVSCHRGGLLAQHRRSAIQRVATAVADAAEPARADGDPQRLTGKRHRRAVRTQAFRALHHLDDGQVLVDLQHHSVADFVAVNPYRRLVPPDVADTRKDEQGPTQLAYAGEVQSPPLGALR